MAASAKKKKASRITTACNPCRSRKQKCSGERPACEQCLEYNRVCAWPEQLKRGPAKGYIEALEQRLHETEGILLQVLPHLSRNQLSSILTEPTEDETGRSGYTPTEPPRKQGVDYWKAFPLSNVENIRRWEHDCRGPRRSQSSISYYDTDTIESNKRSRRSSDMMEQDPPYEASLTNRQDSVDSRHATHRGQLHSLHIQASENEMSSEEVGSASTYPQPSEDRLCQDRPLDATSDADISPSSYYAIDHNTMSFLKRDGFTPNVPPGLSSWDAAPSIKFQQQFLW